MEIVKNEMNIIVKFSLREVIEYNRALNNMLNVYTDSLGQIGEDSNSLKQLALDFKEMEKDLE